MKKIFTISLLTMLALFLTACTLKGGNSGTSPADSGESSDGSQGKEESFVGSLFDLLKKGSSAKCTYKGTIDGKDFSYVAYVSGDKSRTEAQMDVEGVETQNITITDGEWAYMWSPTQGDSKGMKMKFSKDDQAAGEEQPTADENLSDLKKEINFVCTPWIADQSKFKVPSNVTFVDLEETMKAFQGAAENSEDAAKNACAVCDFSPDETAKVSCRESLGCD